MTSRDIMPFGKHGRSKLGDAALTVGEVKTKYPDYVKWLLQQDNFAERNAELHAFFTEGETASSKPAEREVISAETEILKDAPTDFKTWWKTAYGERLRKDGEHLYIAYLRVALAAYNAGFGVGRVAGLKQSSSPIKPPESNRRLTIDEIASTKEEDIQF